MYRENQQSVEVSDTKYDEADGSLLINNLIYEMPKSLSLATGRTHTVSYPQRSSYVVNRNNTIVFDWNTGNSFIDPANSYLRFKMVASGVLTTAASAPSFGSGSACNLFHEMRIRSRSGVELDRIDNYNVYKSFEHDFSKSTNWKQTIGASYFLDSTAAIFNVANSVKQEVTIPLTELSTFFTPLKRQLIPPQLASGLHIELGLESLTKAFIDAYGWFQAGSSLELQDIQMVLDTVTMSDETSKLLNLESSSSGLEYAYPRIYSNMITVDAGSSNINVQIQKAVSQATHVFTIIQNNTNVNSAGVDSFLSESFRTKSWQYRLGAMYYPHIPVQSDVTTAVNTKGLETYLLALASYDKMKMPFSESSMTPADFSANHTIHAVSLERNQSLSVSGLPINNSRVLEFICERDASSDGSAKRDVLSFLCYISVARSYIDNVAVAI